MKLRLSHRLRDNSGQALVEFALTLPVLMFLFMGLYDLARAIYANNTIVNMSREGANLALRTPRAAIASEDVMNSVATTAQSLSMSTGGVMFITEVKKIGGALTVASQDAWSHNASGSRSRVDSSGSNLADFMGGIQLEAGESRFIFEVGYTYSPLFLPSFTSQLHSATVF
jgi:Flp pilus assembly protein TadG